MPDPRAHALIYAVRPAVILRYLAQLQLVLAALAAVPALMALLMREFEVAQRYATVIGVLLLISALRKRWEQPPDNGQA